MAAADVSPNTAIEFARRAEQAGADSVWSLDRLVFENYDPLITLAVVAGVTQRVRLGTSVLLASLRPPALLAKMVASLDQISGGRMTLGIGVGSRSDDFAAAEVPFEHRGTRAEEVVAILRLAWSGAPVRFEGRFFNVDVGPVGPRPAQSHLPIWFGGSAESALRRVGRIADGYIGGSGGGAPGFRATWEKVQRAAETAKRDPSTITPAALVYAAVDDDRDRARERALSYRRHYYGTSRGALDVEGAPVGTADDVVRVIHDYFAAGVETLIIGSPTADLEALDRLCNDVLPRLDR
jgi:probable F420-dependent oxidoreductase